MTAMQWFAFVILPGAIALIAIVGVRVFERLHPVPVAASVGSQRPREEVDKLRPIRHPDGS